MLSRTASTYIYQVTCFAAGQSFGNEAAGRPPPCSAARAECIFQVRQRARQRQRQLPSACDSREGPGRCDDGAGRDAMAVLLLSLLAAGKASASTPESGHGIASVPPAGWTSWNTAGCRRLTQGYIADTIEALAASPLLELGFNRVGIDDCWQTCGAGVNGSFHSRDGAPLINHTEFPDMRALVQRGRAKNIDVG